MPTPFAVLKDQHERYTVMLKALCALEGPASENTPIFELHRMRSEIYLEFSSVPVERVDVARVQCWRAAVAALRVPEVESKKEEFLRDRVKVNGILDGLEDGTLRTEISTRLPYCLHQDPLNVQTRWEGIAADVKISSMLMQSEYFPKLQPHSQPR
jgi:hypothetical protein